MSDSDESDVASSLGHTDDVQSSDGDNGNNGGHDHHISRDRDDSNDSDSGSDDSDSSINKNPLESFPMFSSLNPPSSEAESSDSEDEGSASSVDAEDQMSLPALRASKSPDLAATPTPAPKRKAQHLNGATPVSKRRKIRKTRSNAFVESDEDNNANTPQRDDSRGLKDVGPSGHSPDSGMRKQKSKPTFTQTPLAFKPEPKSSGKKSTMNAAPSPSMAPPRTPAGLSSRSSPGSRLQTPGANHNFTLDERLRMADAVEKFRLKHALSTSKVNELIQENLKEADRDRGRGSSLRGKLWDVIFAVLPGKDKRKVHKYCRKTFHNFKARGGNWTNDEEEQLAQLVETDGTKWAKWSTILNRHPEDLRDRYRNYIICGDQRETTAWTDEESDQLIQFVEEAIDEIQSAKDLEPENKRYRRPIEQQINWQQISIRFSRRRSRLQCLQRWKKMGQY